MGDHISQQANVPQSQVITSPLIFRIAQQIDRWNWLILLLASPFLLFPSPSRSIVLAVVPGLWLVSWLARRSPLHVTPLNISILIVAIMVMVSTWATYNIEVSLPKISGMTLALGIYFAFVRYGERLKGWLLCLSLFLLSGMGLAGLGLLGMEWIQKITFLLPITSRLSSRITGIPGAESGFHPNEIAGMLLWLIPPLMLLSVVVVRQEMIVMNKKVTTLVRVIIWVGTLSSAGTLILTQSRGAIFGLLVSLGLIILITLPEKIRWITIGSLIILGIIGGIFIVHGGGKSIMQFFFVDSQSQSGLPMTFDQRIEIWSRAILGIQLFPITGMGMNTFRQILPVLFPLFTVSPSIDIGHAHNEFLQAALDLGIPGLIGFIGLYIGAGGMLRTIWESIQPSSGGRESDSKDTGHTNTRIPLPATKLIVLGLGGGLFAHLVYGLTDAIALGAKPGFLFWMLLGLIGGLYSLTTRGSSLSSGIHWHD